MFLTDVARSAHKYAVQAKDLSGFNPQIAYELMTRIRQLDWLFDQITALEDEFWRRHEVKHGVTPPGSNIVRIYMSSDVPRDISPILPLEEQLRLQVECFYYVAQRLLNILDQCQKQLPGLRRIAAKGTRRVRNNLIEHANKDGGRPSYSFSISRQAGIRLRSAAFTDEPDVYVDQGIHFNVTELRDQLDTMICRALTA